MKAKLFLILFLFAVAPGFAKTRIHCFDITGKVLDASGQPIANAMIIFHKGKMLADTVHTDKDGNYKHTEAWWPPCDRKTSRKFWKGEQTATVTYLDKTISFTYVPREWARICEGEKIPKRKTMQKDLVF